MTQARAASPDDVLLTENPPTSVVGIFRRLGPGLIIAGSIVGSGELIATTKTGAEAGFSLLWLILIGCVIKVFVQVEMGRYTIASGKTALAAMAEVPGPRLGSANWLLWCWLIMFLASLGQLGGIVGGVGQALQISCPLTDEGRSFNEQVDAETQYRVARAALGPAEHRAAAGDHAAEREAADLQSLVERLGPAIVADRLQVARDRRDAEAPGVSEDFRRALDRAESRAAQWPDRPELVFDASDLSEHESDAFRGLVLSLGRRTSSDDKFWAAVVGGITALVLLVGRYGLIQSFATAMVASFTLITVVNLFALQSHPSWAVTWSDILQGMSFGLPESSAPGTAPVGTALATFGIIGVGATELIAYPYWCLEKGYARFTGKSEPGTEWGDRAQGWMRVMRWDAWCSMVVYTFATLAFYLLGAAVLGRIGLNPAGNDMIRTLGVMYEPVFGSVARWIFLFGAFAVLYSTLFVASASHARVFPDGMRSFGVGPRSDESYRRWVRGFSFVFPLLCVVVYALIPAPAFLVLLGGLFQGLMLPMLAAAALYFRYRRIDDRIAPGTTWDWFLWLSGAGLFIVGAWTVWDKVGSHIVSTLVTTSGG